MSQGLQDQVAIVTGATRGIGHGLALALGAAGARVVVAGRTSGTAADEGTVEATAADVRAAGGEALAVRCDVRSGDDVRALVEATLEAYGRVDVLVNNAGVLRWEGLLDTDEDTWSLLMATNVDGPYRCSMAVLPAMVAQGSGSIINLSSGRADADDAHSTAYSVSKAALDRLTIKLAAEVRPHGIAVNGLRPGLVRTPGTLASPTGADMAAVPTVDDPTKKVIPACLWLAGEAAEPGTFLSGRILSEADFGVGWP